MPSLSIYNGTLTRSFTANAAVGIVVTTTTFVAQAIGTAATDRTVVVIVGVGSANDPSSITVAGNATTLLASIRNGNSFLGIYQLAEPSGTTADIIVNVAGIFSARIIVYALYGAVAPVVAFGTGTSTAGPLSATLYVPAGGVIVSGANSTGSDADATWTTITRDVFASSGTSRYTGASDQFPAGQAATVTCTFTSPSSPVMVAVSWVP